MIKVRERLAIGSVTLVSPTAVRTAVGVMVFAGAMAAAAHMRIPLPFTPIPITLQTGVVLVAGATLGAGGGAASLVLWLGAGLLGAPVFAGGAGLAGPTAGYIIGFVPAAMVAGLATRRGFRTGRVLLGMLAATAVIYACGVAGLMITTGLSWPAALGMGVLPFLAGDVLKLAAALGLSRLSVPLWSRWSQPR